MVKEIVDIIADAAKKVPEKYLKLETTYEPSGIVRERVFCYELYHQIRLILGDSETLTLNGEIDKSGHKDFDKGDQKNPDFVFHIPGEHKGNTIVMEVKGKVVKDDIDKDFKTITTFISKYSYKSGIFLLYNHTLKEMMSKMEKHLSELIDSDLAKKIFIITLPKAHEIEFFGSLNDLK